MDQAKTAQKTTKDGKLTTEQEVLKLEEFVKKLGGVERAKLALDELSRLKKSA